MTEDLRSSDADARVDRLVAPPATETEPATVALDPLVDAVSFDADVHLASGTLFAVSDDAGDISAERSRAHGVFWRGTRVASRLELHVNGRRLEPLAARTLSARRATFVLRVDRDDPSEASLVAVRERRVTDVLHEEIALTNHGDHRIGIVVELTVDADFASLIELKAPEGPPEPDVVRSRRSPVVLELRRSEGGATTRLTLSRRPDHLFRHGPQFLVSLAPGERWDVTLEVEPDDGTAPERRDTVRADGAAISRQAMRWRSSLPTVCSAWNDFDRLFSNSAEDLSVLLMEDVEGDGDLVIAAGLPWFMTLFGRDALISALMLLPYDRRLAIGVLRALARRQGERHDPVAHEQPGKILHELRPGGGPDGERWPYYGSVDATPLFVVLAAEALRWGAAPAVLEELLPNIEAALAWIDTDGDRDRDGYVEYETHPPPGLQNQGWKDSHNSIRFADGTLARGPIALAEVQGYVHLAFRGAARIYGALGSPDHARRYRRRARRLAEAFRRDFWLADERFPAIGLDGEKRRIDGVASNAGHLLWSSILSPSQTAATATRLLADDLFSGWGIRTLSSASGGYRPVSYHIGSVWPHDTTVIAGGLARAGHAMAAVRVIEALVDASAFFSHRLPELFTGFSRAEFPFPVGYPPTCAPQAWCAASPALMLTTLLGLRVDARAGWLGLAPVVPLDALPLSVEGIRVGTGRLSVRVDRSGVEILKAPDGFGLDVTRPRVTRRRAA